MIYDKYRAAAARERIYALSAQVLKDEGIAFTVHNEGRHFIVENKFDFWPGRRKWGTRRPSFQKRYYFGILKLIQIVKEKK